MFDIILLFIDITLFVLSFVFVILDIKSYEGEKKEALKGTIIPKHSRYALLFGLLALIVAVLLLDQTDYISLPALLDCLIETYACN